MKAISILESNARESGAIANSDKRLVLAPEFFASEAPPPDAVISRLFDIGAIVEIIGPPKICKSFFALQMAMCMATGLSFAGFDIPRPRRVLYANLELVPCEMIRRGRAMVKTMQFDQSGLGELAISNLFGLQARPDESPLDVHGMQDNVFAPDFADVREFAQVIQSHAEKHSPEVIVIDPLYPLLVGSESAIENVRPTIKWLNWLAGKFSATVVVIHHDAKGNVGQRDIRDRGAGSGIMARNASARIVLSEHKTAQDAVVLDFMLRSYQPCESVTLQFDGAAFHHSNLPATRRTTTAPRAANFSERDFRRLVERKGPFKSVLALDAAVIAAGGTRDRARTLRSDLEGTLLFRARSEGRNGTIMIGTRAQLEKLERQS